MSPPLKLVAREGWAAECWLRVDTTATVSPSGGRCSSPATTSRSWLANEEVDGHPFAALTPNPMPHRLVGLSLAD